MARLEAWPELLNDYLRNAREFDYAYGSMDCCIFAFNAIEAMTANDPVAQWRGTYNDEAGALALLGPGGIASFVAARAAENSWEEIENPQKRAQRGDIVLLEDKDSPFGFRCGVCVGPMVAFIVKDHGVAFTKLSHIASAWRVD